MGLVKKILLGLAVAFIVIQFIQPRHNKSNQILTTDFTRIYLVPDSIQLILRNACYDCHSNNTRYPWYANVQPMAWMLARHISRGKEALNFSDFGSYTSRRKLSKLKSMVNQVKDNEMPLSSYKIMHKNARLSDAEKVLVIGWAQGVMDTLASGN